MTVVEFNHYSVMLHETIEQLNINPDGIYVDGTLGGGGHAYEVCSRLKNGHFYGIDQDDAAIAAASARLQPFGDKVTVIRNNYVNAVGPSENMVSPAWTGSCWIWEYLPISWIPKTEDFPIGLMPLSTCGWIAGRP